MIKRRPLVWLWLNIAVKIFGLVLVVLCGASALIWSIPTYGLEISEPVVAISSRDFEYANGAKYQPDASISVLNTATLNTWILPMWDKEHGGIAHAKVYGTIDQPIKQVIWIKKKNELFKNISKEFDGNYWIVNTYENEKGILAFIHVENAQGTNIGRIGKSRLALAWSDDNGETFSFLGNIIEPFGDPAPFNVQGIPYIIKDGYFYIYFHDVSGLTVARARVEEVVSAARSGTTSKWMKYAGPEFGFSSDGRGGKAKRIGIDGISHSDAACSSYNNKCYLLLTRMNYGGGDSWIKLYESNNGVKWNYLQTIMREPTNNPTEGFQYVTILNKDGSDNSSVGREFIVYCYKDFQQSTRSIFRWVIDVSK